MYFSNLPLSLSEVVEWMLNDRVPVSLAVEQSLPVLYAADQTALLAVIDRTRKAGHKPSRCVSRTLTFRNMDPDGCKRIKRKKENEKLKWI